MAAQPVPMANCPRCVRVCIGTRAAFVRGATPHCRLTRKPHLNVCWTGVHGAQCVAHLGAGHMYLSLRFTAVCPLPACGLTIHARLLRCPRLLLCAACVSVTMQWFELPDESTTPTAWGAQRFDGEGGVWTEGASPHRGIVTTNRTPAVLMTGAAAVPSPFNGGRGSRHTSPVAQRRHSRPGSGAGARSVGGTGPGSRPTRPSYLTHHAQSHSAQNAGKPPWLVREAVLLAMRAALLHWYPRGA